MSQYASKSALWNAISSCQGDIDRLSEELRQLKNAKEKTGNVKRDADKLQRDMSAHKGSLNEAFGSFSWEGTKVRDVQKVYGEAVSKMLTYTRSIGSRLLLISTRISSVEAEINRKLQYKTGLQYQYNTWKDE